MSPSKLIWGANIPKRLAKGQGRVGPRFTTPPGISEIDSDTISYEVGVVEEGTLSATVYRDGEVYLDDLSTSGTIDISAQDSGVQFYVDSVATNGRGNSTREKSGTYLVTLQPTVPAPVINVLANLTIEVTYEVLIPAIVGAYEEEEITISDGLMTYALDPEGITVPKLLYERTFTVIRTVQDKLGNTILVQSSASIPAQEEQVVYAVGTYEIGVYY